MYENKNILTLFNITALSALLYNTLNIVKDIKSVEKQMSYNIALSDEKISRLSDKLSDNIEHIKKENLASIQEMFSLNNKATDVILKHLQSQSLTPQKEFLFCGVDTKTLLFYAIIGASVSLILYYFAGKAGSLSTCLTDAVSKLPGSNCAEGSELIPSLGLKILTSVEHGKATSSVLDTLTGAKYSSLQLFIESKAIDAITSPVGKTVTTLVSDGGLDLSRLL